MTTWTAFSVAPGRRAGEALADALDALDPAPTGVGCFEIEGGAGLWEVGGYFDRPPDGAALAILAAAHGARDFEISKLPDTDWVAQVRRDLPPVFAGRFVVHGGHDAETVPENLVGLRIEAAMAFGTGHHETTVGCLLALDELARRAPRPRRVADVGCGTAVLAMAAAKVWRRPAVATDIDPTAVAVARANVSINGVPGEVRVARAAGFRTEALRRGPRFDLVFANILARPLRRLAPDMAARTRPGGRVVLSGILTRQAAGVAQHYRGWGYTLERRIALGQWTTLVMRKEKAPRGGRAGPR